MDGARGRPRFEDPPVGGRARAAAPRPRGSRGFAAALTALLSAASLALAGCGGDDAAEPAATTAPPVTTTATTTPTPTAPAGAVTVWFADDQGVLRPEQRPVPEGADPLDAALAALVEGPADPALLPALPAGSRVLGAGVADDVAEVDLSAEFESGYPPGGAAAELAVVGPLVLSAAEASGASRVRLLVEGRVPAPTGTQFDFSEPFSPEDFPAS